MEKVEQHKKTAELRHLEDIQWFQLKYPLKKKKKEQNQCEEALMEQHRLEEKEEDKQVVQDDATSNHKLEDDSDDGTRYTRSDRLMLQTSQDHHSDESETDQPSNDD